MSIINDILDAAKLELNKIVLEDTPFYLRKCLESVFDIVSPLAAKKKINCSFNITPEVPDYIVLDMKRLTQILVNLISNGIKFTKKGSVTVGVSLLQKIKGKKEDADKKEILFQVIDTGIGIEKNDMSKLFKAFTQIDESTTKEYEGTGLGLVISKQLCELMGGRIWCESEPGIGSKFKFTIKVKGHKNFFDKEGEDKNEMKEKIENVQEKYLKRLEAFKGKKIFIIDDKEENRAFLQITLFKLGFEPHSFASAEEALIYIKYNRERFLEFDIGLVDICMPKMDGNVFALELKETLKVNGHKDIPLIALSSLGDTEMSRASFSRYLIKPVHEEKLVEAIFHSLSCIFFSKNNNEGNEDSSSSSLSSSSSSLDLYRNSLTGDSAKIEKIKSDECISKLPILVAEDIHLNQRVIKGILNKLGYSNVDFAANGLEVLDMLQKKKYSLIFMDLKLPYLDGVETSRRIIQIEKDKKKKKRTRIVALTAVVIMPEDKEKYLKKKIFDAYLIKPINIQELKQTMSNLKFY